MEYKMDETNNLTLRWNSDYADKLLPTVVFQAIVCFVGLVGNILVLLVYILRMKASRDDRYFIPILAVFDLLASTVASVFYVFESMYFVDFPSSGLCKGMLYTMTATSGLSALLLIAIGLRSEVSKDLQTTREANEREQEKAMSGNNCRIFYLVFSSGFAVFWEHESGGSV